MGYACPVCEVPQRDGEHLANHLAFTAMLREDDHEAWLDEHVPGWGDETPGELADRVTEHAEAAEFDEVFEDTTGEGGGHEHAHGDAHGHQHGAEGHSDARTAPGGRGPAGFERMAEGIADEAVESVLEEARELTGEMYGGEEKPGGTEDAGGDAAAAEDDASEDVGTGDAGDDDAGDDAEGNDS
ncbi:DUF5810 domain-containing protein [Halorarum salinum]|uniref:Uncharacterized protein n=1 Tax=Halorarum salinum TaxID=2743089 RepID=A0A7D5QG60_9EURY|nr:DUF5810 domain-containing protein [Halobaculum salinum]QLG61224.1 hypothetical protein HUG12_05535 [Halobaculum salinum]